MISKDSIPASLMEQISPKGTVYSMRSLTGGVSAETALLTIKEANGEIREIVLRTRTETGYGEIPISQEYQLMLDLYQQEIPVPQPMLLWKDETILMEFIEGSTTIPEGGIPQMVEKLAMIHSLSAQKFSYLPPREDCIPILQKILGAQMKLKELPMKKNCLLHGDFWAGNLIWKAGEIVAILDWEDAAIGDPHSDVAMAMVELQTEVGAPGRDLFLEKYLEIYELNMEQLYYWIIYVADAALRHMDGWGLEPDVLEHRREQTILVLDWAKGMLS